MRNELVNRIQEALDGPDGLDGDAGLMADLSKDAEAARFAEELARVDRGLRLLSAPEPDAETLDAMARGIDGRMDDVLDTLEDPTAPPLFQREEGPRAVREVSHLSVVEGVPPLPETRKKSRGGYAWAIGGLAVAAAAVLSVLSTGTMESMSPSTRATRDVADPSVFMEAPSDTPPGAATPTEAPRPAEEAAPRNGEGETARAPSAQAREVGAAQQSAGQTKRRRGVPVGTTSRDLDHVLDQALGGGEPSAGQVARRTTTATEEQAELDAEPGTVMAVSPGGWAAIYRNGVMVGTTPARIELPSGRHELELRCFGETPSTRRSVTVRAGETTRLVSPCPDRAQVPPTKR